MPHPNTTRGKAQPVYSDFHRPNKNYGLTHGECHSCISALDDPLHWKKFSYEPSDGGKRLLDNAFASCEMAKRYYTKKVLLKLYTNDKSKRLEIQRLSGDRLPMEHCYINLTVLDTSDSNGISLPQLFDPRQKDTTTIHPRRIFIEGQAGVGKTTLCKKIVHDFLYHKLWSDKFDWILWLPLRNFKSKSANSYSMKDMFHDEYFSQKAESALFAETLQSVVQKSPGRVLFLLDGLDEISQEWNADTPMGSIQPDPETANDLWNFLQEYPRILDIAQIPVQLDALCYTWATSFKELDNKENISQTMTTIYLAVYRNLLRKDLCRLDKKSNEKIITAQEAEEIIDSRVEDLMHEEVNLLE
ncbi:hypothetical protein BO71DRAFT_411863 [Aspergillus ellipticus CBS 707.79]|uniref:NACHT domain-containing protein n=1 Tax=Aspergillus ellipticus CBS 707.79 TaxID=1448320 RepID=A0A319EK92_9EURO|nr:hypothetical protein BO71DRAFT_411863 [Aspergillus ellipticus CBS 707.79]